MWNAQHAAVQPRISAKNFDMSSALSETIGKETPTYSSHSSKMWSDGYHSQHSSSDQYSAPPFSPRSSVAGGDDDDDSLSQASGSTAFSLAEPTNHHQNEVVSGHVRILSQDRYEPPIDHVEYHTEAPIDMKTPSMSMGLTDEQHEQAVQIPESVQDDQNSILLGRLRIADAPNSPPLTARAIDHSQQRYSLASSERMPPPPPTTTSSSKGPLQDQLLSLLSKIELLESQSPTIMASEYAKLQSRISQLETEKKEFLAKRESFFALRDEDISNLIRVRTLLAQERRAHEEIRRLRDEDLAKVIELRNKLAQAVWANQSSSSSSRSMMMTTTSHSSSPSMSIATKRIDKRGSISMGSTTSQTPNTDLWQTAKTAALEQRVLELESANAKLREKLEETEQQQQRLPTKMNELPLVAATAAAQTSLVISDQQQQSSFAALAELSLYAMREKESYKTELTDLKVENLKLTRQVEGLKSQLESSQAVLGYFAQMVKTR